ncbi:MAG: molybdopterin molybdotransferase MoeA [Gammaproteobacteria bacterium]|nr:molybdopterin molybdotransferase MoeA [Gammaproteobacteria bacterium]MCP4089781.1 molybdopterin molybdotransferase MoeA [Gammaproteobacteria bacterium]MCP4278202.1 molybdopterin molybdotransferase MoeA [Gammaproteobacteria bacterium]MCP4831921.1 molybdopterin molybdotransferase MoeA [Gammaproteobacteria bacterium]MCP4927607.1 molybdopterin molybdotransferase MoeA [Gammaproteobacteria bacterium]
MNTAKNKTQAITQPDAFRIDVTQAVTLITESMPKYGSESVALTDATGQILRQKIYAERDQPPFDRATMDGIAISAAGLKNNIRQFLVGGIQGAGQAAQQLADNSQCLEIMTGAVLPTGTDTVIPIERIAMASGIATLEDGYQPEPGQFIHCQASDHTQGDTLLEPGTLIHGPEMAILTAAGEPTVEIAKWPRISIISTGDELIDVGESIADFQIRSSNDRAIEAIFHSHNCHQTTRSHLPDDPQALLKHIRKLHDNNDILILSGGVSMGKYDYVPGILQELGVQVIFHKILQRPGLPMWFGVSADNKPVFALPGNPVSTVVCCIRYVIPAISKAMGLPLQEPETVQLAKDVSFEPDLAWFMPVSLDYGTDGITRALPRPTNTSGDFIGLRNTQGFVELPRGTNSFSAGYPAHLYRW